MAAYQEIPFASVTGARLSRLVWRPDSAPTGVVQLTHGMAEHIRRYDNLAQALNQAGFLVVGHNHLGHGEGAATQGFFSKKGGWDALISDMHIVRKDTSSEYPGIPYFLLGQSMGSFLVRCYLMKHSEGLRGAVLTATGAFSTMEINEGLFLSRLLMLLGLNRKPANIVDKLAFSANNKPFEPANTPYDWLSRDREQVKAYAGDPMCGFPFTASGYHDLFIGLKRMMNERNLNAMSKDLSVLFMSGSRDPVGKNGVGMKKVADSFQKVGLHDVTIRLYEDARHEVFNETNRQEVYNDLINWLLEKIRNA